ncbi:hypothetical protein KXS11_10385 [Plantibacter flavus]|uniref:hypothetical protein n=1 Tax=Plantibacter flavus TaxID=150123 RepID=UPI003F1820B0
MSTIVDVEVAVTLSAVGEPVAFVWEQADYRVVGRPQALFGRRPSLAGDPSRVRIDIETWRVDAARAEEDPARFDLRRDADGRWTLAVAWA